MVYIATDAFGSVAQLYGSGLTTSVLHNPGAILKFTYDGEDGSALAVSGTPQASGASTGKVGLKNGKTLPIWALRPARRRLTSKFRRLPMLAKRR